MWNRYGYSWKRIPTGWVWAGDTQITVADPEHRLGGMKLGPRLGQVAVRGYKNYYEMMQSETPKISADATVMQWSQGWNDSVSSTGESSSSGARVEQARVEDSEFLVFTRIYRI